MATYNPDKPGLAEAAVTSRTPNGATLTDLVVNDGVTMLNFRNADGTDKTATIESLSTCSQGVTHDITVTIPATTGNVWLGNFNTTRFNDANGCLTITWGASVTGVTFSALSCGGTASGA